MQYRRSFLPGGAFFFTVVTAERRPLFTEQKNVATLRAAFRTVQSQRPFTLEAAVVLPDHLHCVWTLPPGDADFSTRWRLVKTWFTKHCDSTLRAEAANARIARGESGLWQQRYWEHLLRDETDYRHHIEYIHFNPVKHGYAKAPIDWPYSSFRRYVQTGMYPKNWGGDVREIVGVGRE
jgi:putative transposase